MRNVWWLAFGLVATAAACGSDDADDDGTSDVDGGTSSSSTSSSGNGGSGGASSSSGSSGQAGSSSSSGGSGSSSGESSSGGGSSSGDLDATVPEDAAEDAADAGIEVDASDASQPPGFVYEKYDLNHLLVAGQSNALGIGGGTVLDTAPRGGAACTAGTLAGCSGVMFSTGVFPSIHCADYHIGCSAYEARTSLVPLIEGDTYHELDSYQVQTPGSSLANQAAALASLAFPGVTLADSGVRMMVSNHARSGNSYECIRKGSCPGYFNGNVVPASVKKAFEDGLDQVAQAKTLAAAKNWTYAVRGVFLVHGEANHNVEANYENDEFPMAHTSGVAGTTNNYREALIEWQKDYETDIVAATQQTVSVPLYLTQMTNWTWIDAFPNPPGNPNPNHATRSIIPGMQLDAFRANPTKIILVTPTYPFSFNNVQNDKVHLTPAGSRRVGEYFAKAYAQTTFTGVPWKPLYPIAVTREGAVVTVQYHVPVMPLKFDTVNVTDPNTHRGFSFYEEGASPAVVTNQVIDGDKVVITLSKTPVGANKRIRYAYDGTPGAAAGPTTGPRGNLCDSDATVSNTGGAALVNWSVAYSEPVN